MCTYFKTETDVAQNPLDEFFSNFDCQKTFRGYGGTGLLSEKTEALHAELNERVEAATSSYSAEVDFYNTFIRCLRLRIIRRSDQGV